MMLGKIRVEPIYDGMLWLDGGAMFGIVPKKLWSKVTKSDAENRIRMQQTGRHEGYEQGI